MRASEQRSPSDNPLSGFVRSPSTSTCRACCFRGDSARRAVLFCLTRGGWVPKPRGRLKRACLRSVKFYGSGATRGRDAAKWHQLQAVVVGRSNLRLWLMTRYFTGSVSWVTDLTPYLPQYVVGHYEEKMTRVSALEFILLNTGDGGKCVQIHKAILADPA